MRIVLAVLAAAAAVFASGCAAPRAAIAPVTATLTDKAITLDVDSVPAGPVKFTVINAGTIVHSLVLLKTDTPHDQIPADKADPARVDEAGILRTTGQFGVGETREFSVQLVAGKYVLVCNEPAHYIVGMHAPFTVK